MCKRRDEGEIRKEEKNKINKERKVRASFNGFIIIIIIILHTIDSPKS